MLKVGITGQNGFIGEHLYNSIGLFPGEFNRIEFQRDFFEDEKKLNDFVVQCDVIVHLAAKNRHNNPDVIYDTNLQLVQKLITALEKTTSKAHVLFSSSTQEEKNNPYGKSKKEGRSLIINWAKTSNAKFTGLIIPNVFGPFGHPNYNSVIATFCYKLSHNETPTIDVDGEIKLIYVGELVNTILNEIRSGESKDDLLIAHTSEFKVSALLTLLEKYRSEYMDSGTIPQLKSSFETNLFNTFRSYIDIPGFFPVKLTQHEDHRGKFVEVIRLNVGGQVSFSTTVPGITRGNHFHTRKIERFAVIKGKALIQLRRIGTDKILNFHLDGNNPAYVDMPVWYTHNIKNIGEDDLYTIFWINEFYNAGDPDTYFQDV
jgi:UDP-2-acetamido-2,6-beta-L-arabino-hexul-4-ose reductase